MDWIDPAQGMDRWRTVVNTVTNLGGFHKMWGSLLTGELSIKWSLPVKTHLVLNVLFGQHVSTGC